MNKADEDVEKVLVSKNMQERTIRSRKKNSYYIITKMRHLDSIVSDKENFHLNILVKIITKHKMKNTITVREEKYFDLKKKYLHQVE